MKEGWEYKKLSNICEILNGFAFKSSKYVSEGIRVIRITNVQKGRVEDSEPKYYPLSSKSEIERYLLKEGDLLLSLTGNVGRVGCLPPQLLPAALNQRVACLRLKGNDINKQYLYHFLNSNYFENICIKNSSGAAQLNLSTVWLSNYEIPVPSLSEQQSIVDYLDSAFAKIDVMKANAEKALDEAKALFQASLKEMLEPKEGWKEKKLGEMSEIQSGFAFKSTQFQKRGDFQVIRMGNVRPGIIRYNESPVFIDSVDENIIEKSLLKVGDMIITQTGSRNKRDYGFTVLIDKEKLLLNQRIARIRVVNTITNKYLLYYSWTDYFRDQYFANEGGTVGQGNVGIDAIRYAVISYPSLSEQQSIVATLDSLKSKVDRLQENFDKISQE